jgi:MFS family permease
MSEKTGEEIGERRTKYGPGLIEIRPEPSRAYRWVVLLFVSVTMGSSYYMYDSINPLERIFIERLGFSATDFGWLNSAYAVSAILTLLIGGFVIDKMGTKRAITLFAIICCLGATLTAVSGQPRMMIAGRAVLGLGGESLVVAATTVIAKWFRGKELSFAFGIKITIARLASVASDNSPTWASKVFYPHGPAQPPSWRGPLLLAVGAGAAAVGCSVVYWAIETHAERKYLAKRCNPEPAAEEGLLKALRFSPSYWFVVGICLTFYSAIFPFRTFAIDFFTNKTLAFEGGVSASESVRMLAHQRAGMFASMLPLMAMIATPLLGLLSDKIGKRSSLMLFASILLMPVYFLMAYSDVSLIVPICMMGVAFSVIPAVMWPSVAYIVDEKRLGKAYALMTLIEQIGFFTMNLLIGKANDYQHAGLENPDGYRIGLLIFSGISISGFIFAALLRIREAGPHRYGLETITVAEAR